MHLQCVWPRTHSQPPASQTSSSDVGSSPESAVLKRFNKDCLFQYSQSVSITVQVLLKQTLNNFGHLFFEKMSCEGLISISTNQYDPLLVYQCNMLDSYARTVHSFFAISKCKCIYQPFCRTRRKCQCIHQPFCRTTQPAFTQDQRLPQSSSSEASSSNDP